MARSALSSSSLGGISGVLSTEISTGADRADRPEHEGADHPVRDARFGGARDDLLEEEEREVGQGDAQAGEERLGQESLAQLGGRQLVRDERPVRLHRGVVAGVQQPQQDDRHPHRGDEREQEQAQAAADRPDQEERFASAPAWTPGPVGQRADQRLDEQTGDRSRQVQDRQIPRIGAEELIHRVHRGLLHAEAVLDAEEPEVHDQDRRHRHQRLGPHDARVLQVGSASAVIAWPPEPCCRRGSRRAGPAPSPSPPRASRRHPARRGPG